MNKPIPMILSCPSCNHRHIDVGEFATKSHHTHACQYCGMVWRPAIVHTCGVQFLPGFKNKPQQQQRGKLVKVNGIALRQLLSKKLDQLKKDTQ